MSDIRIEVSHRIVDETDSVEPIEFQLDADDPELWIVSQDTNLIYLTQPAAIALANSILALTRG